MCLTQCLPICNVHFVMQHCAIVQMCKCSSYRMDKNYWFQRFSRKREKNNPPVLFRLRRNADKEQNDEKTNSMHTMENDYIEILCNVQMCIQEKIRWVKRGKKTVRSVVGVIFATHGDNVFSIVVASQRRNEKKNCLAKHKNCFHSMIIQIGFIPSQNSV